MGRNKITDGSKLKYPQFPIMERDFEKIGKENLEKEFKKLTSRLIHNIEKGRIHNQVNLLDSIAEIENSEN